MGCGGQDLRHLGSGFELGAIFELKPSLVPPFRGHARRGAVCSPLIVSRRPRAVGSSPRDGGGTSGLTPARFDLDVAPQSRLNLDALSTNTRWSLQTRAVRHDTRVPTLSEISRTPRKASFGSHLFCAFTHYTSIASRPGTLRFAEGSQLRESPPRPPAGLERGRRTPRPPPHPAAWRKLAAAATGESVALAQRGVARGCSRRR